MNILITGGASGLGEVITKKLASNQSNVVYFTYSNSNINANSIETEYKNTNKIKCDFTNQGDVESLVESIESLNLDVLVHNAYSGNFIENHFHKIKTSIFQDDFKNNILPVITITQNALKQFRKKKSGKIITILSSALIDKPTTGASSYLANKAYLKKLTQIWATENVNFNIQSNSVSPSLMKTALTEKLDYRLLDKMKESSPLKKFLDPQDVADTVNFLCSASEFINGIDIPLNSTP